eukprot:symbB.v1.2.024030.t1/scaffold2247.1/size84628/3
MPAGSLKRQQDERARSQSTQERQSVWQLRCKLEQCRREANLLTRALERQFKDVRRLEGQAEQESDHAMRLETKTAALLTSSPDAELRFQGEGEMELIQEEKRSLLGEIRRCRSVKQERLGKLLHLEEAAEDWADAAAVPVELVFSLGQARFGVQEALLKLTRSNEMMACAAEEHDALLLSLHTARQERRVRVAQLASSESALLASRAELGAERTNALVERRTRAVLEAETEEFQAEMGREQSEESLCGEMMLSLEQTEGRILEEIQTEEWLSRSAADAKQRISRHITQLDHALRAAQGKRLEEESMDASLQANNLHELHGRANELQSEASALKASQQKLRNADLRCHLDSEKSQSLMGVECARANELVQCYTATWEACEVLRMSIREEQQEAKAAEAEAHDALLESKAADAELLGAREQCEVGYL